MNLFGFFAVPWRGNPQAAERNARTNHSDRAKKSQFILSFCHYDWFASFRSAMDFRAMGHIRPEVQLMKRSYLRSITKPSERFSSKKLCLSMRQECAHVTLAGTLLGIFLQIYIADNIALSIYLYSITRYER